MKTTFNQNGANYETTQVTVKGNVWSVTVVTGAFNYISILKVTNNPWKTLGKRYESFDEAQQNYKCAEMKLALLSIETGLI